MRVITFVVLLAGALARQDVKTSPALKDQVTAHDKVTSILIHPGPAGPRHVILSEGHEIISNIQEGVGSRSVSNYYYPSHEEEAQNHHTVPPPPRHHTYGPARPVTRSRPQLHHRLAHSSLTSTEPYLKVGKEEKGYLDSTHKFSYIKHGKGKEFGVKQFERPDLTYRDSYSHHPHSDYDEERLYKESIGALEDYSAEHKPYKKPTGYTYKHQDSKYYSPVKSYKYRYNKGNPSGFDDHSGGQVVPLVARFYKQPLPVIQTHLPADNTGLYIQYVYPQPQVVGYGDNYYPLERSSSATYDSDWTPISGVPTKSYDSLSYSSQQQDSSNSGVVMGKSKSVHQQHIHGNSEGVVSAVVRVKQ